MNQKLYTALIQQREQSWIGWLEEISGVNCQEPTKEELLETLSSSLKEVIEMNRIGSRKQLKPSPGTPVGLRPPSVSGLGFG